MTTRIHHLIESTRNLMPYPRSMAELRDLLDDPVVEVGKIVPVVERDPALTANLLKVCNSAAYGLPRQVGSVKQALVLVGNRPFLQLAFSMGMAKMLRTDLPGYGILPEELWWRALGTGYAAARLMAASGRPELESRAYTAGLLHDVGIVLLDKVMLEKHGGPPETDEIEELLELERAVTGLDHAEAGAELATAWNFPEALIEGIRYHHCPEEAPNHVDLVRAVHAADRICSLTDIGSDGLSRSEEHLWETLERIAIPSGVLSAICSELPAKAENLHELTTSP